MKNFTKTFNIGEYAEGGRIKIRLKGNVATVLILDWDTRHAMEVRTFHIYHDALALNDYLLHKTTFYYANRMQDWIIEKVGIPVYSKF